MTDRRSMFSGRFLSQNCSTDRLRRSFVPRAIRLFTPSPWGPKRTEKGEAAMDEVQENTQVIV